MMTKAANGKNDHPRLTVSLVAQALNEAAQDAVEAHCRANQPLVIWQDGETVSVSPHGIVPTKPKKPRRGDS